MDMPTESSIRAAVALLAEFPSLRHRIRDRAFRDSATYLTVTAVNWGAEPTFRWGQGVKRPLILGCW
jgi:hypothetical protein